MRFIKPLDTKLLDDVMSRLGAILTIEDNVVHGGFGSAVAEYISQANHPGIHLRIHGIPDRFVDHGTPAELYRDLLLDPVGIAGVAKSFLQELHSRTKNRIDALVK